MKLLSRHTLDNSIRNFDAACAADPTLLQQILHSWENDQLIWPGKYVRRLLSEGRYESALYIYCSEQDKIAAASPTHRMIMHACDDLT